MILRHIQRSQYKSCIVTILRNKMVNNFNGVNQSVSTSPSSSMENTFINNNFKRKMSNSSSSDNSSLNPTPTNSFTNLSTSSSEDPIISIEDISSENPCFSCQSPCSIHPSYPSNLNINRVANLHDTVQPHIRHVIISTGKSDWNKIIELDSGNLSAEFDRQNSTLSFLTFLSFWGNDVLIFPDNLIVRNVTTGKAKEFYDRFLSNKKLDDKETLKTGFAVENISYKSVILICGHKTRDIRCGIAGPILKNEFEKVLKEKRMDLVSTGNKGVPVYLSSHVGGHQFAGNVIVYRDGHGIWYGRVTPCHVPMIIEKTIIEGKIIKDLYRGSMINGKKEQASLDW
ncbi:12158_t:CDS:2 [Funneliformis geosporum]|nr:12158_t:CDS:2 [Funneliformis geosporum]